MPAPPRTPRTFGQILELIWWRLDKALDLEMIRWSAMLGALEALERGTTAIVDHHSSPNAVDGSLTVIAQACAEVGVRVSTCYEVTDRNGIDGARAGIRENDRYLRSEAAPDTPRYVGAHASFTLSDETLDQVCRLASDLSAGVHIHVAEGREDVEAGRRLEHRSQENWLLAHAVHLDRHLPGTIVHNPLSNMNNSVGYAAPARRMRANRIVLGSDGIGSDMIEAFRIAYLRQREDDVTASPETAWSWLEAGWDLFPEALEDRVTWSYAPMGPWHLAYTPGVRPLEVSIRDEVVFREGKPTRVDAKEVRARAAEQSKRLFERLG